MSDQAIGKEDEAVKVIVLTCSWCMYEIEDLIMATSDRGSVLHLDCFWEREMSIKLEK